MIMIPLPPFPPTLAKPPPPPDPVLALPAFADPSLSVVTPSLSTGLTFNPLPPTKLPPMPAESATVLNFSDPPPPPPKN